MANFRADGNRPSSGVLSHGREDDGTVRAILIDQTGRLITGGATASQDNIKRYRSDSDEKEAQVSTSQSRLVYLKGLIIPGSSDNTQFFIHVLDAASPPGEDDAIDPITTFEINHEKGYPSKFSSDAGRKFPACSNGLRLVISMDRYNYDTNNLTSSDLAYFEADYVE